MIDSSGFMQELWDSVKINIPKKEREAVAENWVRILDEYGLADSLENDYAGLDRHLQSAIKSHFGIESDEEEEYDE